MSIGRRETSNLRRRRLLVYQNSQDEETETAADRRQFEKLREARRPSAIYGTSVNRRLRGRWFSLVPVKRRAMAGVGIAIMALAVLLCIGHWAAISWQPLAYRTELARPLRLDRPDSLGTWVRAAFLLAAAGTSVLVYQLRRYRNDDFRGSYRIWPPVIILMVIASIDCVCGLVPWGGELIELLLRRRVALAGSDWIRIVITIGGAALALRLLAEVRHSKLSCLLMSIAIVGFAIPMSARWGIMASDTPIRWLIITSAPLMASAALWVACGAYLRKLFREVRKMDDDDAVSQRVKQWKSRLMNLRSAKTEESQTSGEPRANKRKTTKAVSAATHTGKSSGRAAKPTPVVAASSSSAQTGSAGQSNVARASKVETEAGAEATGEDTAFVKKPGISWRFWRKGPGAAATPGAAASPAAAAPQPTPISSKAMPQPATSASATNQSVTIPSSTKQSTAATASQAAEKTEAKASEPAKPANKSGGLFGWFKRKDRSASMDGTKNAPVKAAAGKTATSRSGDDDDEMSDGDDPSIDWASMGKAERRRLRREMKRGGQAA